MNRCQNCKARPHSCFENISDVGLNLLASGGITSNYKKGQALFYQDNSSMGAYCIQSGKIKLERQDVHGHGMISRIASEGDLLGSHKLFTTQVHESTAVALEDAQLCFIDKKIILQLIRQEPEFAFTLVQRLSSRISDLESRVQRLPRAEIQNRCAELLLDMKRRYGTAPVDGCEVIDISLSRRELAEILGTTTETVVRVLTLFKHQGFITEKRKHIAILSESKLQSLVNTCY